MRPRQIAIIGAGIAGLTAALAFAQRGAMVQVFEQAPEIRAFGAGLQITPNGARALRALGIDPAEFGLAAAAVVPMCARSGRALARFDLSGQTPRYHFVHRADLIGTLAAACTAMGVQIHLGAQIGALAADGRFAFVGQRVQPDLTLGADGLHSVARAVLNGADSPFFTGQVAWRAIITAPAAPAARIWMAPRRHVVTYPLTDGRVNIVAVQERRAWAAEGWHHSDDPANLRAAFADCAAPLRDLLAQVDKVHLWGLFRHDVAPRWHNGQIALLGDAAHPTLPFLAQGANLAIEDAYVLAQCAAGAGDLPTALARYQSLRRARVQRAIAAANGNARNYHLSGARRLIAHNALRLIGKIAPDAFIKRLGWLYDHDVCASSE